MQLIDLATLSRKHFFFFIKKCNETYRSGHDLSFYRELIDMHRKFENLEALIEEETFLRKIYNTLEKWNMNQKGARLAPYNEFQTSLNHWKDFLIELYNYKLY